MATAAELAVLIKADTKGLDSGLDAAKKGLGGLGGTAGKMGIAVGAGFAAAGAAAVAGAALVGKAWFGAAGDAAQSVWDLQGTLGITAAEAEGLGDVGIEVFKNNWGGSIGEATKAVGQLKQVFGDDVLDSELQSLTEQAFALEQVFGIELVDSGRAAQAMFNNFGTEGMKAFDIIAASQQKLGPAGDDLVDTFNEYSGVFDQLGFGAEEMASSLVDAVQAGARNTDVAADAVKEFGIRIQDATYLSDAAMAVLPASMLDIKKAFEDGSVSGRDAMLAVGEEIANIEDPMRRYEAGVLAFGTKWEDMGEAAVIAMATSGGALDDMEGAAARAGEAVNQGIGAAWEQTKRTALTAMMEISGTESFELLRERVVGVLGDIQSRIGDFVTDVKSVFGDGMSEAADATALVSDSLGIMSDDIVDAQGGVSGFRDVLVDLKAKFDDVQAAFEEGGIVAALSEIVGFDIQPIIDGFIAAKDAVVDLTGFIIEHKDEIILVAGAYAGFKTGLAISGAISAASGALGKMTTAWKLYREGAGLATIATRVFGVSVKTALGPVGWAMAMNL